MSTTNPTTIRPAITTEMVDQFVAFDHVTIFPVIVTRDIKSKAGNFIARKGEQSWGAVHSGDDGLAMPGSVQVWTPNHYAGCKTSTVRATAVEVFTDNPVSIAS